MNQEVINELDSYLFGAYPKGDLLNHSPIQVKLGCNSSLLFRLSKLAYRGNCGKNQTSRGTNEAQTSREQDNLTLTLPGNTNHNLRPYYARLDLAGVPLLPNGTWTGHTLPLPQTESGQDISHPSSRQDILYSPAPPPGQDLDRTQPPLPPCRQYQNKAYPISLPHSPCEQNHSHEWKHYLWLSLNAQYPFTGTPGYESYWQSEYEDEDTDKKDEMVTFYQTFSRLGVAQVEESLKTPACHFKALDVIEAHVYNYADNFQVSFDRFDL